MASNEKDESPGEGWGVADDLIRFLEAEIWPRIPPEELDLPPMSRAEREKILGIGPQGC